MSVLRTKTESAVIAVNDDIITLFAIPKFSIIKPQINALIESQGYISKHKYELTTKLVKDLEKRIIELEKDL